MRRSAQHLEHDTKAWEPAKVSAQSLRSYFSSFEELILLDADAFPVRNPDNLLDLEPYKSDGLVMWPDFWVSTASHHYYDIAGSAVPPLDFRRASESGIILYSKRLHAEGLLLATYHNYFGPDFYCPLLSQGGPGEGEKETFIHAALAMNEPFYAVHTPVLSVGSWINGTWFIAGMKQRDPVEDYGLQHPLEATKAGSHDEEKPASAKPLFLHNNMVKLAVGHLVNDYEKWRNETGHRVRLWGPEADQVKEFGYDVEHALWNEMLGAVQYHQANCG
jgi:alpha 1,2-mannosyltransferase